MEARAAFMPLLVLQTSLLVCLLANKVAGYAPPGSDEADHGLSHEKPLALTPSESQFFKPGLEPLPGSSPPSESESKHIKELYQGQDSASAGGGNGKSAKGGVSAGVVVGLVISAFVVGGGFAYIYLTRRVNVKKATSILPTP